MGDRGKPYRLLITSVNCKFFNTSSDSSSAVDQSMHYPKFKGLIPATVEGEKTFLKSLTTCQWGVAHWYNKRLMTPKFKGYNPAAAGTTRK